MLHVTIRGDCHITLTTLYGISRYVVMDEIWHWLLFIMCVLCLVAHRSICNDYGINALFFSTNFNFYTTGIIDNTADVWVPILSVLSRSPWYILFQYWDYPRYKHFFLQFVLHVYLNQDAALFLSKCICTCRFLYTCVNILNWVVYQMCVCVCVYADVCVLWISVQLHHVLVENPSLHVKYIIKTGIISFPYNIIYIYIILHDNLYYFLLFVVCMFINCWSVIRACVYIYVCSRGLVVRVVDLRPKGRRFEDC